VILQVLPDLGQVVDHLDAVALQVVLIADARKHQQLW
jgi:hypothetical protein